MTLFKLPLKLAHLQFTLLVFGLQPSPAILGEIIMHHIDKYQSRINKDVEDSCGNAIYMVYLAVILIKLFGKFYWLAKSKSHFKMV